MNAGAAEGADGESPLHVQVRAAIEARLGERAEKKYSSATYETYLRECTLFADWCEREHGCATLEECREHRDEYVRLMIDRGRSAATVSNRSSILGRLYGDRLSAVGRSGEALRVDITVGGDRGGSPGWTRERFARFCRATGLRRPEMAALKRGQLSESGGGLVIRGVRGKGGEERDVPVAGDEALVREAMKGAPEDDVFAAPLPAYAEVRGFRMDYARSYYRSIARPADRVPPEEIYRRRKGGQDLDKKALAEVRRALGCCGRIHTMVRDYGL